MTEEAPSVSEPKLPAALEAAMDVYESAVDQHRGRGFLPDSHRHNARAALVSAVLKWGEKQHHAGALAQAAWQRRQDGIAND